MAPSLGHLQPQFSALFVNFAKQQFSNFFIRPFLCCKNALDCTWGKVCCQKPADVQRGDTGEESWPVGHAPAEARGRTGAVAPSAQTTLPPDASPATGRTERMRPTLLITNAQQDRQDLPPKCLTYRITKSFSTKSLPERETKFIPTSYKSVFSTQANTMQKCPMTLLPGNQITPQIYLQHNDIHWHLLPYFHAAIKQDFSGVQTSYRTQRNQLHMLHVPNTLMKCLSLVILVGY